MSANPLVIAKLDLPPILDLGQHDAEIAPLRSVDDAAENQDTTDEQGSASDSSAGDGDNEAGSERGLEDASLPEPPGSTPGPQAGQPDGAVAEGRRPDGDQQGRQELDPALARAAQAWANFERQYVSDPAGMVRRLAAELPADQMQAVLAQLAPAAATPAVEFRDDGELTIEERFVKHEVAPALQTLRQQAAALPAFQKEVAAVTNAQGGYIAELAFQNAVLKHQLQAVQELQGLSGMDVDRTAVEALVRQGQTYDAAVKAVAEPKTKVAIEAAKSKLRQVRTPTDKSGGGPKPLPANATFQDEWREAKRELAARR